MQSSKYGGFILLALLSLVGCGKDENVDTCIQEDAVGGPISVHVSCGDPVSRPFYTWSDGTTDITATMAMQVKVVRASAPDVVWAVVSDIPSQNAVQSPIQHGTTQSGTNQTANTELDLSTDVTYRVTVTKADGMTTGFREFTIQP